MLENYLNADTLLFLALELAAVLVFVLLIVIFRHAAAKRKKRRYAKILMQECFSNKEDKQYNLRTFFHDVFEVDAEDSKGQVASICENELAIFKRVVNIYLRQDNQALVDLYNTVDRFGKSYQQAVISFSGATISAEGTTAGEGETQAVATQIDSENNDDEAPKPKIKKKTEIAALDFNNIFKEYCASFGVMLEVNKEYTAVEMENLLAEFEQGKHWKQHQAPLDLDSVAKELDVKAIDVSDPGLPGVENETSPVSVENKEEGTVLVPPKDDFSITMVESVIAEKRQKLPDDTKEEEKTVAAEDGDDENVDSDAVVPPAATSTKDDSDAASDNA